MVNNKCNAIMGTCEFYFRKNFKRTKSKFKYIVFCRNRKNSNPHIGNCTKNLCPKLNEDRDYTNKSIDDEQGKLIW